AAERHAEDLPHVRLTLERRDVRPEAPVEALAERLGAPANARRDVDALASFLRAGERRLVLVDGLEQWFLRDVGGLAAWDTLQRLVEAVGDRIFWVGAFSHHAHEYLRWTRGRTPAFRDVVHLPAWSEGDIGALLQARMDAAGFSVVYDDLLVGPVEGVEAEAQLVGTARDYNRLLWDYAEGSPRAALAFWLRSLVPDGERTVRVRLFKSPDPALLEGLPEAEKFVLACAVWHERLTAVDAARALHLSPAACGDALARLAEHGVLYHARDDAFAVSYGFWPTVIRYLKRKHLVES
ncbi:MAG TPA: hypothetical protein VHB21_12275, partial [Minicystis sp.]|nr:hypothetical protein [Minicystis sp.]